MTHLICNFDLEDEVVRAFQTILNAISLDRKKLNAIQKERDSLLSLLRTFETERLSDDLLSTELEGSCRKRLKKGSPKFGELSQLIISDTADVTCDDLNAAFRSSICEDEEIEPTQFSPNKSIKILQEQNKENAVCKIITKESTSLVTKEKSPTVLSKRSTKKETSKREHTPLHKCESNDTTFARVANESAKWHSKAPTKNNTPRRLFDIRSTSDAKSSIPQQQNTSVQKKQGVSVPYLRQSIINFPKCEEETYYETIPTQMKIEQICKQSINDSVIALTKDTNEIITVDESQYTQEIYQSFVNTKTSFVPDLQPAILGNSPRRKKDIAIECEDCKEYHRLLGRRDVKNPPKKFGVCSKHHRNVQCLDTPPGFWNPKIIDSESDHVDI